MPPLLIQESPALAGLLVFVMYVFRIDDAILELATKYNLEDDPSVIIDCVEWSLVSAIFLERKRNAFVLWEDVTPHLFTVEANGFKEVETFSKRLTNLILKLLTICLKRESSLKKLKSLNKIAGSVAIGRISKIQEDSSVLVDIDGTEGLLLPLDQIPSERSRYFEGAKLFFYIKKTVDLPNGSVGFSLSRVSKNLVVGILKTFLKKTIDSFERYKGIKPVIFCSKRIAGQVSVVYSELIIPSDVLKKTRILSGDKYIEVRPFDRSML